VVTKVQRNPYNTLEGEMCLASSHFGSKTWRERERANLNNNYARSGEYFEEEMRDKGETKEGRGKVCKKCGEERR
jgi:hypothetical protein